MCINLTETAVIAIVGMICGFVLKFHSQVHESRCSKIGCCGIQCEREVLNPQEIIDMRETEETNDLEMGVRN